MLGTDASIPTHIENILKRNYCTLETGRRLVPSKLGLVLVQGYHLIDSGLVLPKVRSDIEDQCGRIAKGLANKVSSNVHFLDRRFHLLMRCTSFLFAG
jgi:DNA topoisomerase-3